MSNEYNGRPGFFGRLFRPRENTQTQNMIIPGTGPTGYDPANNINSTNPYDFWKQLSAIDQNVLNQQEKLIKQKSIMDIAGSTMAAWENMTAPLPDRMAATRFTGTEASLPTNLMLSQRDQQEGNLISQGRGLYRATGNPVIISGMAGSVNELNKNFNTGLASTYSDFMTKQQASANQINNLNAEALAKANEYNAKIIAEDNLRRSQIAGQMFSQVGQAMVDRKAGLINVENMRGQNLVFRNMAKKLVDSGNWELIAKYLPALQQYIPTDVNVKNINEAGNVYQ